MTNLIRTALMVATISLCGWSASAAEPLLTVEFPERENICLSEDERSVLLERMKKLVIEPGSALTIIAYTSIGEKKARPADCVDSLVPNGISAEKRVAVLRALHISELGRDLHLPGFGGTPMLLIGSGPRYRNHDAGAVAIIARRGHGDSESDRRVEIWASDGDEASSGAAATIMAPALLPPIAYSAGGSTRATVSEPNGNTISAPYTSSPDGQELLGWTFVGLGLTAIVGGGFSFAQSGASSERADQVQFDRTQATTYEDDAALFEQIAYWSGGLGVGLATLGIILIAAGPSEAAMAKHSNEQLTIVPTAGLDGAVILYGSTLPGGSW